MRSDSASKSATGLTTHVGHPIGIAVGIMCGFQGIGLATIASGYMATMWSVRVRRAAAGNNHQRGFAGPGGVTSSAGTAPYSATRS